MIRLDPRPLTADEREVLKAVLEKGAQTPQASEYLLTIDSLRVIAHCECGCGSIDFAANNHAIELASGIANLRSGEPVEVIAWGDHARICGLAFAGGPGGCALPVPSTVRSWKNAEPDS